jgi:hypothetical protein
MYGLSTINLLWSYLVIGFYNFLNLSGLDNKDSMKWVYYTHLGKRYRIPLKKRQRGPSMRDPELEVFFENDQAFEEELRGPNGDYHGMLLDIKSHYKLHNPLPDQNWDNLLFKSSEQENRAYFEKLVNSQTFKDYLVEFLVDVTSLTRHLYNKLDNTYKNIFTNYLFNKQVEYSHDFTDAHAKLDEIQGSLNDKYSYIFEWLNSMKTE